MSEKHLWLFTMRFPYGTGEAFLENELPVLAKHYAKVVVVPLFAEGALRAVPPNVEVRNLVAKPFRSAGPVLMLKHWRAYRKASAVVRASAPDKQVLRERWSTVRSQLRQALNRAVVVAPHLFREASPEHTTLYSYWSADWATVLGLLKVLDPRVRYVSRMHGFDLYADRAPQGWPVFQAFHVAQAERIFVASQAGAKDLVHRYPAYRQRFEVAHLGTHDHGAAPWEPAEELRLVSCSNLVPLKRVDLLVEALKLVKRPVHWTHFGDGPERERLDALVKALPTNVRVDRKGAVPNAELIAWYQRTPMDLFVHLSASEGGVPVSMQEAASFGIPLLATAAGGAPELVGPPCGELLPVDVSAHQVAAAIDRMADGACLDAAFRSGVREAWRAGFRAEVNYARFLARMEEVLHPG
jgi:colanic acid/amylovoran biosynthesis glycosyltransferase